MTEPTDNELQALWSDAVLPDTVTKRLAFSFARAVLAKWGTPAPVGVEPVAHIQRDTLAAMLSTPSASKTNWPVHRLSEWQDKAEYVPLYTAEQVLAMGRVPLPEKQIEAMWQALASDPRSKQFSPMNLFAAGVAMAEAVHNIKQGGQHGTDN